MRFVVADDPLCDRSWMVMMSSADLVITSVTFSENKAFLLVSSVETALCPRFFCVMDTRCQEATSGSEDVHTQMLVQIVDGGETAV